MNKEVRNIFSSAVPSERFTLFQKLNLVLNICPISL